MPAVNQRVTGRNKNRYQAFQKSVRIEGLEWRPLNVEFRWNCIGMYSEQSCKSTIGISHKKLTIRTHTQRKTQPQRWGCMEHQWQSRQSFHTIQKQLPDRQVSDSVHEVWKGRKRAHHHLVEKLKELVVQHGNICGESSDNPDHKLTAIYTRESVAALPSHRCSIKERYRSFDGTF